MAICVTWIQGVLRIGSSGRFFGKTTAYDLSDQTRETFPAALANALRAAGVKAGEVFLATDISLIVPSPEEVPPSNANVTRSLLLRRADKGKIFAEPVTVGFTEVGTPVKGKPRRVLSHVVPLAWVEQIDKELLGAGFFLSGLFSASLALTGSGGKSAEEVEEKARLVLADAEGGLLFVVLDPSGAPLFYRTLASASERGAGEIGKEIRRLQLYAEQKLGRPVGSVSAAGGAAQGLLRSIPPMENLTVGPPVQGFNDESYLRWVGDTKAGQTDNVLPGKISGRAGRERMRKLFHMALLVFLACGVGWFSNRMIQRGNLVEKTRKLAEERMGRTGQVDLAIRQQSRFRQQKEAARIVEEETVVPMAELLFRDTAACLPPELRLTRFLVELDEEKSKGGQAVATYSIRMEGEITRPNAEVKPAVEKLSEALAKSPWKIQVMKRTGQSDKDPEVPAELKLPGRFYVFATKRE